MSRRSAVRPRLGTFSNHELVIVTGTFVITGAVVLVHQGVWRAGETCGVDTAIQTIKRFRQASAGACVTGCELQLM